MEKQTATTSRRISNARSEVGYATDTRVHDRTGGKHARRAYHRAVRRGERHAIREALAAE